MIRGIPIILVRKKKRQVFVKYSFLLRVRQDYQTRMDYFGKELGYQKGQSRTGDTGYLYGPYLIFYPPLYYS